jgi:hypothetical protein
MSKEEIFYNVSFETKEAITAKIAIESYSEKIKHFEEILSIEKEKEKNIIKQASNLYDELSSKQLSDKDITKILLDRFSLKKTILLKEDKENILSFIRSNPECKIKDIKDNFLNIESKIISSFIKECVENNIIAKLGKTRNTKYFIK